MRDLSGRTARLSQAATGLTGRWQMLPERIEVQDAWLELPGAKVKAAGPALVYDAQTSQILHSSMVGTVQDAPVLRDTLADLGVKLPESLELAGRAAFEAQIDRQQDAMRIELGASGEQLTASWPGVLQRRSGSPLSARAVCRLADDGSILLESGQLDLPGGHLAASAEFAAAKERSIGTPWSSAKPQGGLSLGRLPGINPAVARSLRTTWRCLAQCGGLAI